jgi:hypothetical protein
MREYIHSHQFVTFAIAVIAAASAAAKITVSTVLVTSGSLGLLPRSVLAESLSLTTSSTSAISQPKDIFGRNRSLPSSSALVSQMMGGGALTVSNGTGQDAYVKLVEPNSRALMTAFIVKSNSSFTQEQIPDGTYRVLFVLGNGWNSQTQSFTKNKSFAKFNQPLNFTTLQTSGGIQYRVFKVTLHPVAGGQARTSGVSQKEFDSY